MDPRERIKQDLDFPTSDVANHSRSIKQKKGSINVEKGLLGPVPPLRMNYDDR